MRNPPGVRAGKKPKGGANHECWRHIGARAACWFYRGSGDALSSIGATTEATRQAVACWRTPIYRDMRRPTEKEVQMNRKLGLIGVVVFALNAGFFAGGLTSSLADELSRIEAGVGELRSAILSLFAPPGAIVTETNPNY